MSLITTRRFSKLNWNIFQCRTHVCPVQFQTYSIKHNMHCQFQIGKSSFAAVRVLSNSCRHFVGRYHASTDNLLLASHMYCSVLPSYPRMLKWTTSIRKLDQLSYNVHRKLIGEMCTSATCNSYNTITPRCLILIRLVQNIHSFDFWRRIYIAFYKSDQGHMPY